MHRIGRAVAPLPRLAVVLLGVVVLAEGGLAPLAAAAPPAEPRIPVRPADAAPARDRVVRHLHDLLVGTPVRHEAIAFVPLHARTPGEARRTGAPLPRWSPDGVPTSHPIAGTLRLRPIGKRPLLLVPGRAWTVGARHFRSVETALLAAGRPGFLRVAPANTVAPRGPAWIGAEATGDLLRDPGKAANAPVFRIDDYERSDRYRIGESATRPFGSSKDATIVGCVAVVGGEPVMGWIFGDAPVLAEARRDLIALAVAHADGAVAAGTPDALLRQRASRADARGRALSLLRRLGDGRGRTREVPGGGRRWRAGTPDGRHVARALLDDDGRLVFLGVWRVPDARPAPVPTSAPPAEAETVEDPKQRRSGRWRGRTPKTPNGPRLPLPGAGG